MSADLEHIDDAILRALDHLRITTGNRSGVFRLVDRWAGDLTQSEHAHREMLNKTPACLVAFDGEEATDRRTSLHGSVETISESTWNVLVIVADTRDPTRLFKSNPNVAGAYKLASKVQGALTNLYVPGLHRTSRLRFRTSRVVLAIPGEIYVLGLRFTAVRALDDAPLPLDTDITEFDDLVADVNLEHSAADGGPAGADETLRDEEQPFDAFDTDL